MASRTSRKEWVRDLHSAFGVGRYGCKRVHWASERSVGYVFLIGDSVQNHPNPHPCQTGSKDGRPPPPESRHVLRTTPTVTQGWVVELVQHPHRDDVACPIGPRLQMLRNIHNVLVRIYARSRGRSAPQVAEGVLRLFGSYF